MGRPGAADGADEGEATGSVSRWATVLEVLGALLGTDALLGVEEGADDGAFEGSEDGIDEPTKASR